MAAPEYVPTSPTDAPRVYRSAVWTDADKRVTDRPAVASEPWPRGPRLADPSPDAGYALKLVKTFEGRLVLTQGEHEHDVLVGCAGVATKRSSLFGRGPLMTDVKIAFTIWGFLAEPDPTLVRFRRPLFAAAGHQYNYVQRRQIADVVSAAALKLSPSEVSAIASSDWRKFFDPDAL